jgi:hypothetical protein
LQSPPFFIRTVKFKDSREKVKRNLSWKGILRKFNLAGREEAMGWWERFYASVSNKLKTGASLRQT